MAVAEERALASDKDLSDFAVKMDVTWRPKGMEFEVTGFVTRKCWCSSGGILANMIPFQEIGSFCRFVWHGTWLLEMILFGDSSLGWCSNHCHWERKRRRSVWIKLANSTQKDTSTGHCIYTSASEISESPWVCDTSSRQLNLCLQYNTRTIKRFWFLLHPTVGSPHSRILSPIPGALQWMWRGVGTIGDQTGWASCFGTIEADPSRARKGDGPKMATPAPVFFSKRVVGLVRESCPPKMVVYFLQQVCFFGGMLTEFVVLASLDVLL